MSFKAPSVIPSRLGSIPAFPSVALKLLAIVADDTSSLRNIATCIAADSVLSGQLIKRANAADQLRYCEVRDVLQAAVSLGIDRAREISLTAATSGYARAAINSDILRPCWHHTLACAIVASELARLWGLRPSECYTAGLFHDIGRLGLLTAYPGEYEQIMAEGEGQHDDLTARELEHFGIDHLDAGVWLARKWNLPESIVEVIEHHHELPAHKLDQLMAVQVACRVADVLGYGISQPPAPPKLDEVASRLPEWTRKQLAAHVSNLQEIVSSEIRLFENTDAPASEPSDPKVTGTEPETAAKPNEMLPATFLPLKFQTRWVFLGTVLLAIALMLCAAVLFVPR